MADDSTQKIDKWMVLACIMARLQNEGRELALLTEKEIDSLINDALDDLMIAAHA